MSTYHDDEVIKNEGNTAFGFGKGNTELDVGR